jgi:FKBP-type peptidyl-prolyl cis-trans isomerase
LPFAKFDSHTENLVWFAVIKFINYRRGKSGRKPKNGDLVRCHYTGKLADGTVFDSSRTRGRPLSFVIGIGSVIRAWDEGVARMCLGERAYIVAPPEYGYGEEGGGLVPPGATLYFDVELLQIGDDVASGSCTIS